MSLGIFSQPTKAEADGGASGKRQLIAHIIATRTAAPCVTDATMDYPKDWRTNKSSLPNEKEPVGHQNIGGTICIHSLAVRSEYQAMGIGSVLLKCYIQRMKDAKIADRLALLAHDDLKNFYGRFGFDDMGPSQATFGGGNWNNMVSIELGIVVYVANIARFSSFQMYRMISRAKAMTGNTMTVNPDQHAISETLNP